MLPTGHLGRGYLWGLFFPLGERQTFKEGGEVVAGGPPDHYPQWLARALNSTIYDVKCNYEGYRTAVRIAVFYVQIAAFYTKFPLLCPIL